MSVVANNRLNARKAVSNFGTVTENTRLWW